MKQSIKMSFAILLVAVASVAVNAAAPADYAGAPAKHWHEVDTDWMKSFHNPMEGLEMGLDLRLREVYGRNILTANEQFGDTGFGPYGGNYNNYHWQRYRTRWSTKWLLDEDITFNTRLTWEFWGHCAPDAHVPTSVGPRYGKLGGFFPEKSYDFDEAIFDTMNIQFRNAFDLPLTITVGRQDIILGTGWLVLDGTPGDGSRTIFFDALRGTYQLTDATKLDVIYIQQYDDPSKWLPPINHNAVADRRNLTQSQDEKGAIFYLTNKLSEMTNLDAYYIYKHEEQSDMNKWWIRKGWTSNGGDDADVHTVGGRLYGNLNENWSYSAEGAIQFGRSRYYNESTGSRDLNAHGANTKLQYAFNDDLKNEVHVGYEYLSGDDPDTDGTDERFNTLWGDWPQTQRGGDLQSYVWAFEGEGLGNVSNLHRFGIGHSFKPHQNWTLGTDYNLLWADQNSFIGGAPGGRTVSDNGLFRGHMLTGLLTYQCCKQFRTQFLVDYFIPGGFYASPGGDESLFARVNMEWTF